MRKYQTKHSLLHKHKSILTIRNHYNTITTQVHNIINKFNNNQPTIMQPLSNHYAQSTNYYSDHYRQLYIHYIATVKQCIIIITQLYNSYNPLYNC
jgi:hypothetical protein